MIRLGGIFSQSAIAAMTAEFAAPATARSRTATISSLALRPMPGCDEPGFTLTVMRKRFARMPGRDAM